MLPIRALGSACSLAIFLTGTSWHRLATGGLGGSWVLRVAELLPLGHEFKAVKVVLFRSLPEICVVIARSDDR